MKQFAKIFEVDGQQVLFYLEPSGDEVLLHQIVRPTGFMADVKLGFNDDETSSAEERAQKAFDEIDMEHAANLKRYVRGLVE